jgi:hypothetical protein
MKLKWTKEMCAEEALKYKNRKAFAVGNNNAYYVCLRNKWLDDICQHMIRPVNHNKKWTIETIIMEAQKYNTRKNFQNNSKGAYLAAFRNGWLDDVCLHMEEIKKPNNYWTKEKCAEVAKLCKTVSEFQNNYSSAYNNSINYKWLDEFSKLYFKSPIKPMYYWTKEKCAEEALKYKTKSEFEINSKTAYSKSIKNKWIDDICVHMMIIGNRFKRCIYVYEFIDNSVYVGLTYDIEKRHTNRIKNLNDAVTKHIIKSGLQPIRKQITDYIDIEEASKLEGIYVEKYRKNGWNILNRNKTGATGSIIIKWTYEACKKEALKYINKTQFIKNGKGAYSSARKNEWLDDICSHMIINKNIKHKN